MASRLDMTVLDLKNEVCRFLGFPSDITDWSSETRLPSAEKQSVESIIVAGLRQFYYPPGYRWSFLRPVREIVVWPTTTNRTIAAVGSDASGYYITLNTDTFYESMIGCEIEVSGGGTYTVTDTDTSWGGSATKKAWVSTDPSAESIGASVTITSRGWATLPIDCAGVLGDIWYNEGTGRYKPIEIVSQGNIQEMYQVSVQTGWPRYASITREPTYDGSVGQRDRLYVFPIPDNYYRLVYLSEIRPEMQDDDARIEGGPENLEAVTEACLSVAEQRDNDEIGIHTVQFEKLLAAAIARDKRMRAPERLTKSALKPAYDGWRPVWPDTVVTAETS